MNKLHLLILSLIKSISVVENNGLSRSLPTDFISKISRYDPLENRGHEIQTISLDGWHIFDNDRHPLPPSSLGQFYSDDVYIIRWKYKLNPLGNVERKADISRDRLVYWIWQGHNANLNEKGISSILGVFLTEEKGAHVSERELFHRLLDKDFSYLDSRH